MGAGGVGRENVGVEETQMVSVKFHSRTPLFVCETDRGSPRLPGPHQHQTGLDPISPSINKARISLCLLHFYSPQLHNKL